MLQVGRPPREHFILRQKLSLLFLTVADSVLAVICRRQDHFYNILNGKIFIGSHPRDFPEWPPKSEKREKSLVVSWVAYRKKHRPDSDLARNLTVSTAVFPLLPSQLFPTCE